MEDDVGLKAAEGQRLVHGVARALVQDVSMAAVARSLSGLHKTRQSVSEVASSQAG